MKFVVAGAGGYVGRFLSWKLVNCGHQVTAISRRGTAIEGVVNLRHDLSIAGNIPQFPADCDVVINLVAQSNLGGAGDYFEINRDIPARLVQEAIRHGVGRVIHISTIGVHGVSTKGREDFSETDQPSPVAGDIYAISKLAGEHSLMEACGGGGD
jgi:nucleoside-diphosphate-sugar epimerase